VFVIKTTITHKMKLLLCSLLLAQCYALSIDELQQLMHEHCGLGTPHAGKKIFSCPFSDGGAFNKENIEGVLEGDSIIQLNDFVFDREFRARTVVDYKHTFSLSSNQIELVSRDKFQGLLFSIPEENFPRIEPPPFEETENSILVQPINDKT